MAQVLRVWRFGVEMKNTYCLKVKYTKQLGMTMIELLVTVAILGATLAIAMPGMTTFITKNKVDAQTIELQRLLLSARNASINSGQPVTVCPLNGNACSANWQNEISVFINGDDPATYNVADDELVKIKAKIEDSDKLTFSDGNSIVYLPTGRIQNAANVSFVYCPSGDTSLARGVEISLSGRAYLTQDTDNDNKDETRAGAELSCS